MQAVLLSKGVDMESEATALCRLGAVLRDLLGCRLAAQRAYIQAFRLGLHCMWPQVRSPLSGATSAGCLSLTTASARIVVGVLA